MNIYLEQMKGFIKVFELINNGNYEGPDYLVDEFEFSGNALTAIEKYLISITTSNEVPASLNFERIDNWQESIEVIFQRYFSRNVELSPDLYKVEFLKMLNNYIDNQQFEVLGSGINNGCSCITEYFREVCGNDLLFVFNNKILIFHFGIND